jgi:hypothetical protein
MPKRPGDGLGCATEIIGSLNEPLVGWRQLDQEGVNRFLKIFGIVLVLGGLGHTVGVLRFYAASGVPDANRVLLDVWIAEAQLLGGGLFWACARARAGKGARLLAVFGALTIIAFAAPLIPVLFARAPVVFRIPVVIYFVLSVIVLFQAVRQKSDEIG